MADGMSFTKFSLIKPRKGGGRGGGGGKSSSRCSYSLFLLQYLQVFVRAGQVPRSLPHRPQTPVAVPRLDLEFAQLTADTMVEAVLFRTHLVRNQNRHP